MGFSIRSRDEEAKSPMEVSGITKTKEGRNVHIQDQSDAHHFFDQKGLVHHEFVPEGQTVNQHFYKEVLGRLHDRVQFVGEPFMAAPSRQHTCTHCSQCEAVLGQQTGHLPRAPTLFARSSSMRLLALSQNETYAERHPFCVGGNQSHSDTTTQGLEGKGLHGVLLRVAETNK